GSRTVGDEEAAAGVRRRVSVDTTTTNDSKKAAICQDTGRDGGPVPRSPELELILAPLQPLATARARADRGTPYRHGFLRISVTCIFGDLLGTSPCRVAGTP